MPVLYVANPSAQTMRTYYRLDFTEPGMAPLPGAKVPKYVDIKSGQQEPVGGKLHVMSQVEEIVSQLSPYGACKADEIDRYKGKISYVYSVDKAVSQAQIDKAVKHNKRWLEKDGADRRKKGAIAAASVIESPQANVSIEQVTESEYGGDQIADAFTVDKTNDGPASRVKGARAS